MNKNLGVSIVCPISSKIKYYAGCLVLPADDKNGLEQDSEVITFQIWTVTHGHMIRKMGIITKNQLAILKTGLNEILEF